MLYAILAYHEEAIVQSWTKEQDAARMAELLQIGDRLEREKRLGPAARLGATRNAVTLRGKGDGMIIDGPFAETKEQLLGFYIVDCPTLEAAIATARDLRRANPTAVYEIRPISLFRPGTPLETREES
jgi:hypothetical protein